MPGIWTPLLELMSERAREAWPFIQEQAAKGLGSEEIVRAIQASSLASFRRTDMLALAREATGAELVKSDIERWPKDIMFPISRVRESVTKIVAPFSYTLRLTVLDEDGEEHTVLRQAHSETLLPMEEVADTFLESISGREQYQTLDVQSAEVVDIQRAGPSGSL